MTLSYGLSISADDIRLQLVLGPCNVCLLFHVYAHPRSYFIASLQLGELHVFSCHRRRSVPLHRCLLVLRCAHGSLVLEHTLSFRAITLAFLSFFLPPHLEHLLALVAELRRPLSLLLPIAHDLHPAAVRDGLPENNNNKKFVSQLTRVNGCGVVL